MTPLEQLHHLRDASGPARTRGLSDATITRFLELDPALGAAIRAAGGEFDSLRRTRPDLVALSEDELIRRLQAGYLNFYSFDARNPFVALAARGPWLVTVHGAVVHDSGGYGMLGFGHEPGPVVEALARPQVMANVMTANVAQLRLVEALRRELGHARADGCPFDRFVCMNSGSESMSVAARISDAHAMRMTGPDGPHAGKRPVDLGVARAFHGRTFRPASLSDSTRARYRANLASFQGLDNLWTVPANDCDALRAVFERAREENVFIHAFFMEPVQGEGSPGVAMTREFYDLARELTLANDAFLVVDSIQAGLRAWGTLSLVDYPGFEDCAPPDMESWSKALNAGQFPLSVLGLTERAAQAYVPGIYGNTMTTNPRALDVACAVLEMVTDEVRRNVREQGCKFVGDLQALQAEFPEFITEVQGTGLLFACELDPDRIASIGPGSAEELCRLRGVAIIHGGRNALRFTPHFRITDTERELMMGTLREVFTQLRTEHRSTVPATA